MSGNGKKSECSRCGSRCREGGPALHDGDLLLFGSGCLSLENLVTVRRGELAVSPVSGQPEPVAKEFLKIQGGPVPGAVCFMMILPVHAPFIPIAPLPADCSTARPLNLYWLLPAGIF